MTDTKATVTGTWRTRRDNRATVVSFAAFPMTPVAIPPAPTRRWSTTPLTWMLVARRPQRPQLQQRKASGQLAQAREHVGGELLEEPCLVVARRVEDDMVETPVDVLPHRLDR